jgi:integrase
MLQKVCGKLGLPLYHCHEFRHTFIRNLVSKGVPLPVISKVSGDTQETILKRYSHMLERDEIMILQALSKL